MDFNQITTNLQKLFAEKDKEIVHVFGPSKFFKSNTQPLHK